MGGSQMYMETEKCIPWRNFLRESPSSVPMMPVWHIIRKNIWEKKLNTKDNIYNDLLKNS